MDLRLSMIMTDDKELWLIPDFTETLVSDRNSNSDLTNV